jgi:prephenate dehydrogenase
MRRFENVAIVGVGLIGASIGLGIRRRGLASRVVGVGRRSSTLEIAQKRGAITDRATDLERGVAQADLVVVCTPVATIVETVERVARACPPHCLLTDAGSTKTAIVEALAGEPRFIGGHPLAGGENSGPQHGRADLFEGRVVVLTPTAENRPEDARTLEQFWTDLGARVKRMDAREHDRALAATSHLPHLIAAALAGATPGRYAALVATGWLDTTRIAAGDPELWRQILLDNRDNVLHELDRFGRTLGDLRASLERADGVQLEELLTAAKRTRDALGS